MNIAATQYNINRNVLEIYVAGCNRRCKGCHNSELFDFDVGEPYEEVLQDIIEKCNIVDGLWILGGEPLDQDRVELYSMLRILSCYTHNIALFTSYDIKDIPDEIKKYLTSGVKCGMYIENDVAHEEHGMMLASSNQHFYTKEELDAI